MIKNLLAITVFFVASSPLPIFADTKTPRPKIGLVLKGGGALGFAHVGVLKVLERYRVPVDYIAGTSMGAIVGAAYAAGARLDDMEQALTETDWEALFGEKVDREHLDYRLKAGREREIFGDTKIGYEDGKLVTPRGIVQGQNIRLLFQRLFGPLSPPSDFDQLSIPFRAVTADIETGEAYVPRKGDLATIVRASMSVPAAFSPVEVDGHLLVDGGIVDNLPIDVVQGMGADILIIVDLQCDLAKRDTLTSPLSISGQVISLLLLQNSVRSRSLVGPHDIVIEPNVNPYTATEFSKGHELMAIGEAEAERSAATLQKLSLDEQSYSNYSSRRTFREETHETLDFIQIHNNSSVSDRVIREKLSIKTGDSFDPKAIEEAIQRIYQMGYFESVEYSRMRDGNNTGIEVKAKGKEWLNQFFRLGVSLEDNLEGDNSFRLAGAFRSYDIGTKQSYVEAQAEIGKIPRFSLELYQPFQDESPYFVAPKISYERRTLNVSNGDTRIAEYDRENGLAELIVGRRVSTVGEVRLGYGRGYGELSRRIGDPSLQEKSYDIGDLYADLELDNGDKPDFPTKGYRVSTRYRAAVEDLGAPSDFQDLSGVVAVPYSIGRNTIILRNNFATTFGQRPVERSYTLGGFLGISGTVQSSIPANDYYTGGMVFFHRFTEYKNPFFDVALFAGASYELTTVHNPLPQFPSYDLIQSGSIFIGGDTPFVPIYIGFGMADIDEQSIYLTFGRLPSSAG